MSDLDKLIADTELAKVAFERDRRAAVDAGEDDRANRIAMAIFYANEYILNAKRDDRLITSESKLTTAQKLGWVETRR
jgi:hypothetical protein